MKQSLEKPITLREKIAQLPLRTKRQLLLVGVILLILMGQNMLAQLGARLRQIMAVDAQFSFQPNTGNLAYGQNLPLTLKVNVNTDQLVFSHVEVIFDKTKVILANEVTTLNTKLTRKPIPVTSKASANTTGKVVMALGAEPTNPASLPTGTVDLATLTFTPTAPVAANTNTQITVSFVDTKLASSQTQSIPVSTLGGIATITLLPTAASPVPSPVPSPSAAADIIFSDSFESGNTSAWSSETDAENDLTVTTGAKLVGAQGLAALIDNTTSMYVQSDHPNAEPRYRARFYFDPNTITMASADIHQLFQGRMGTSTTLFNIQFNYTTTTTPSSYRIRPQIYNDAATVTNGSYYAITDAPHYIEVDWQAATAAGANNGSITLWIDGVLKQTVSAIDNDTHRVDAARLGPLSGIDAGTTGTNNTYYIDAFESRKSTYIGPVGAAPATPVPTPSSCVPSLLNPADSLVLTSPPVLTWTACTGRYYQVNIDGGGDNALYGPISDTSFTTSSSMFTPGVNYLWRVRTCDNTTFASCQNPGSWSSSRTFWWMSQGVATPTPLPLVSPLPSSTPSLGWKDTNGNACNSTNYSAYYPQAGCTGTAGYRIVNISPQSPCSTDGTGVCFNVGGAPVSTTMISQYWYHLTLCTAQDPGVPAEMYSTLYTCTWR